MRVLVTGVGGPASIGVTRCLALAGHKVIGADCDKYALQFAESDAKYLVPRPSEVGYIEMIQDIIDDERIDFVHAQPDPEVLAISEARDLISAKTLLPKRETVRLCQNKLSTNRYLLGTGVPVPKTIPVDSEEDIWNAHSPGLLGDEFWVRDREGAAGRGSWHAKPDHYEDAAAWVNSQNGWGRFIASEYLPGRCVTWQSVWKDGKLICAQSRERLGWSMANRSPSGVTGITGIARTISRADVAEIGQACVLAIESSPSGIFGVDMKEDAGGVPRVTEVNIGRFFTTIEFFARLWLNMPDLYVAAAFGQKTEWTPCEDDWYWLRSMDARPRLVRGKNLA